MENVQSNMAKNKKLKHVMCYFALVILVILLFVPLAFKIIFKEKEPEKQPDVVTILLCNKGDESISSTFLNDDPKNLSYSIPAANVDIKEEDNKENQDNQDSTEQASTEETANPVLRKLINYAAITYNEEKTIASINFSVESTRGSIDYETIFSNVASQKEYFQTQGFTCTEDKK